MIALAVLFWASVGLILYSHVGYPLLLRVMVSLRGPVQRRSGVQPFRPSVSLIIAAHDEEEVIRQRLENAIALDYPRDKLEIIVASDGSTDQTAAIAREMAASDARVKVLELLRRGKVKAQDAAAEEASGALLAFSDANAFWEAGALEALVRRFADPKVGYVCGRLRYLTPSGDNQEAAYWRYETAIRALESRLGSITGGNGAIYAVRREAYLRLDPRTSHDLSLPFNLVRRGWHAIYEPLARSVERSLPTVEGEFRRKRRMMSHAWPMVITGGMLDPRGYGALYAIEIFSHRILRYASPFLHLLALGTNIALIGRGGGIYIVTLAAQLGLLAGAALGYFVGGRVRLLALCNYYVMITASLAAGLWDWLRKGTPPTWEKAEGRG